MEERPRKQATHVWWSVYGDVFPLEDGCDRVPSEAGDLIDDYGQN